MGDFNAHVGIIGEQELNYNGKLCSILWPKKYDNAKLYGQM